MFSKTILFATILPSLISAADPQSRTVKPEVNAALKTAATNFDRNAILSQTSAWYYDFDSHQNFDAEQGAVINADAASFPALTGMGISIALLKLAPCGMLPPHYHPRAHNLVTAVSGNTTSWMIGENGVKTHMVDLIPFRVTIFPQGSLHVMQNNGCEEAILISSLSSDDSGTLNILPALFSLPIEIIQAGFGAAIDTSVGKDIPAVGTGAIIGSAECKKRCGIAESV